MSSCGTHNTTGKADASVGRKTKPKMRNDRRRMELAYERNQKRIEHLEKVVGTLSQELMSDVRADEKKDTAPAVEKSDRAKWFGDAF